MNLIFAGINLFQSRGHEGADLLDNDRASNAETVIFASFRICIEGQDIVKWARFLMVATLKKTIV